MSNENRTWVIVKLEDFDELHINLMIENSIGSALDTLTKSTDGKNVIMKFDGPGNMLFDGLQRYNHNEILTELAKSEWQQSSEEGGE